MPPEPRTVVFGAFDRHNLGDLLFAHVVAALLRGRDLVFAGIADRDLTAWGGHRVAARNSLERCARRYPGDGTVQVHFQRARARCGEQADWQSLWGRFDELAPVIRVEQMGDTKLPLELSGDELDEDGDQAKWVYLASAEQTLRDVVQEDFLAARQIAL